MQVLLLLLAALVIIVLTEWVKKNVTMRPEAIAAIFSVLAVVARAAVQTGEPPDIPALVNGLYLYLAASLGYDKAIQPIIKSVRRQ